MIEIHFAVGNIATYFRLGSGSPTAQTKTSSDQNNSTLIDLVKDLDQLNTLTKSGDESVILKLDNGKSYKGGEITKEILKLEENYDYNQVYKFLKRMLSVCLLLLQDPNKYDQRYDTFLADILDNERHLPNMTILSWNYDAQLEFAYAQYARNGRYILDLWDEINVYNKTCPTNYDSSKPFALIKINGTAFFRNHQFPTNQYKAAYEVEDEVYETMQKEFDDQIGRILK